MKKLFYFASVILVSMLFTINAKADSIKSIDMDIYIDDNGTAHITETWIAKATEGTEWFKTYENYGNSKIIDFTASMDGKDYEFDSHWDINASLDEKAYKNGFNYIDSGVELCFGKSSFGTHTYVIKYTITNFVVELNDAQMVYWTLAPGNFETSRGRVYIKIYSSFNYEDTLDVWGFGYEDGTAAVGDGYIDMDSINDLSKNEKMVLLAKFPLGTFNVSEKIDDNFDNYLQLAKKGSSSHSLSSIIKIITSLFVYVGVVVAAISSSKKASNGKKATIGNKKLPKERDIPAIREIDKNINIFRVYFIANEFNLKEKNTDLIGAFLLKWIKEGKIDVSKGEKEKDTKITFQYIEIENDLENSLYKMLRNAAGDDLILESKEFEKWCKKHYNDIVSWYERILVVEKYACKAEGKLEVKQGIKKSFYVTDSFRNDAIRIAGIKKFLKEFSSIDEKEAIEVKLWEEYLIYAQIFGMAEKVAKQFKKLYPEYILNDRYDTLMEINMFSRLGYMSYISSYNKSIERANRYNSGGGGMSFFGGGGGSFGGGFSSGGGGR